MPRVDSARAARVRAAAQALVSLIDERVAGAANKAATQLYAQAMPQCERWMDLAPLSTVLRIPD